MTVDADELSNEELTDDGHVIEVMLDRPEKSNPVNETVVQGLLGGMDAVAGSEVRVVVISGAGGTFSSGGDLGDIDEGARRRRLSAATRRRASWSCTTPCIRWTR
jgi:enoyl-CoA hydratase/carnithine racemase